MLVDKSEVCLNIVGFEVDSAMRRDDAELRRGRTFLERIYVLDLEFTYLFMYSWTRAHWRRFRTKRFKGTPLAVL
jgi:hypothetical protein